MSKAGRQWKKKPGIFRDCIICNEPFYVPPCYLKRLGSRARKYCSIKCRSAGLAISRATHGHAGIRTRTYLAWKSMKNRALNQNDPHWKHYGARGITVCDRWVNSFETFLADMGECPPGLTLERINNDGNYEPANCKWVTQKEQTHNQRRSRMLTFNSKTQCLAAWAEELQISGAAIRGRLSRGWPIEIALTAPVFAGNRVYLYQGVQ